MKAFLLLVAVIVAVVVAVPTEPLKPSKVPATPDFLTKQKNLLRLLWRIQEPNTYTDQVDIGKTYKLEDDVASYKNSAAVKEFIIQYKKGFLPRGDIFSVYYEPHRIQMVKLFEVFFYADSLETLYKVSCWARDRVNEGIFVYALSTAIFHRQDTHNFVLPPYYEMFPQMFVDNEVINKAHHQWFHHYEKHDENIYIPVTNYTGFWLKHDAEQTVSYFGEDIGINMFNKFLHIEYPFWMDSKKYGLTLDRKGELFYWMYQQLLSRYEMERIANNLPETEAMDWEHAHVEHGYAPMVSYKNGVVFPVRPDNTEVQDLHDMTLEELRDFERRIRDAIDRGYFFDREGQKISLKDARGIDWVGKLVEGFPDVPTDYFGKLTTYAFAMVSHIVDPLQTLGVAPGVLEQHETATRDPAFFSLHKSFNKLFLKYKNHLTPYKRDELFFSGVKIDSVEVDKLVTYFDDFELDLYSLFSGPFEADKNVNIKAHMPRLNHKTFDYKIEVNSDKDTNSIVRIFLGPKYDIHGHELTLEEKRLNMVEMDKFFYPIKLGKNVITRSSADAFITMKDELPTKILMKKIDEAIAGKTTFELEESYDCGFPDRLLLPRGRKGGMPFTLFVMVTPFEGEKSYYNFGYCDSFDNVYPDTKAFGYPFDRKIIDHQFNTPNMFFKDVVIFHKTLEEINKIAV